MKNKIIITVVSVALSGCLSAPIAPKYSYSGSNDTPAVTSPVFLGWDENGHKVLASSKNTSGTRQKSDNYKNEIKSTILNEDTIICETDTPLLTTGQDFIKNQIIDNSFVTGSDLINGITKEKDSVKDTMFQIELLKIQMSHPSPDNGTTNLSQRIDELSNFLKVCAVNKEVQAVEVIERKPISQITKIKAKLSNGLYEFWTYDNHLTVKN